MNQVIGNLEKMITSCPSNGGLHTQGVESLDGTVAAFLPGRSNASFSLAEDGVLFRTGFFRADAFGDACDVCPFVEDPNQDDSDGDGLGDAW